MVCGDEMEDGASVDSTRPVSVLPTWEISSAVTTSTGAVVSTLVRGGREPTTTTTPVSNWSSDIGTSTSATLPAETVTDFWTERKPLKSARSVTRPDGAESWKWPHAPGRAGRGG